VAHLGFVAWESEDNIKGRRTAKFSNLVNLSKFTNFSQGGATFLAEKHGWFSPSPTPKAGSATGK